MLNKLTSLAFGLLFAFSAIAASASERASLDEAKAMAEKAAAYYAAEGEAKAVEAFNGDAQFKDRDLYVFFFDTTGTIVAHGANKGLIGKNLSEIRDPSGKQFVKEMLQVSDRGWVDYQWQNPTTKAVEAKRSYVINSGDRVLGVGAYVN